MRTTNIEQARQLAIALRDTMPADPARKAQWIHTVRCLRELLSEEIPLMDKYRWEDLCYPQDEVNQ